MTVDAGQLMFLNVRFYSIGDLLNNELIIEFVIPKSAIYEFLLYLNCKTWMLNFLSKSR